MRDVENDCVGCPQGCIHCGRERSYYLWTCDGCGRTTTDYDAFYHDEDEKDYCPDCYEKICEEN